MFKKLIFLFLTLLFCNCSFAYEYDEYYPALPKGSLIKVVTKIPYTTEHLELGSLFITLAVSLLLSVFHLCWSLWALFCSEGEGFQ